MLKTEYNELVKKVNGIQTTDTGNLVKKADYNTKIGEVEKKMLDHDHNNKYITTLIGYCHKILPQVFFLFFFVWLIKSLKSCQL